MIGIAISAEQLAAAPPEVRRWLEREVASTLAFAEGQSGAPKAPAAELAACGPEEVARIFELIRDDYFVAAVFCELGREGSGRGTPPYCAIDIADLVRRLRLGSVAALMARLEAINAALRRLRGDAQASLFGFDQSGRLYIHEATQRNVADWWSRFLAAGAARPAPHALSEDGRGANDPSGNGAPRAARAEPDAALDEMLGTSL